MNIHKFMMPEVIFGENAIEQVGESCQRLGARKVFIVSDPGVIEAGWFDKIIAFCRDSCLDYATFYDVTINPKDIEVEKACEVYLENECDAVIGVGGGSAIDTAKAVAILSSNGGTINEYEGIDKIEKPLPPQIMVPTTAGSGSEVSQFSVIVDTNKKRKMTIVSKSLVPDIAIIDPNTLSTKGPHLTASTGLDVLTHAIEAYVSIAANPLTDVHARNALKIIGENLRPSVASRLNQTAKTNMAMASLQAGLAFSNAILGAIHAMSHAIGGRFPMMHGDVNAVLLPHVMSFNLISTPKKFKEIASLLGENVQHLSDIEAGSKAIDHIKQLSLDIGAPQRLSDMGLKGIDPATIQAMSEDALNDACMVTNPRDMVLADVEQLFQLAL